MIGVEPAQHGDQRQTTRMICKSSRAVLQAAGKMAHHLRHHDGNHHDLAHEQDLGHVQTFSRQLDQRRHHGKAEARPPVIVKAPLRLSGQSLNAPPAPSWRAKAARVHRKGECRQPSRRTLRPTIGARKRCQRFFATMVTETQVARSSRLAIGAQMPELSLTCQRAHQRHVGTVWFFKSVFNHPASQDTTGKVAMNAHTPLKFGSNVGMGNPFFVRKMRLSSRVRANTPMISSAPTRSTPSSCARPMHTRRSRSKT